METLDSVFAEASVNKNGSHHRPADTVEGVPSGSRNRTDRFVNLRFCELLL